MTRSIAILKFVHIQKIVRLPLKRPSSLTGHDCAPSSILNLKDQSHRNSRIVLRGPSPVAGPPNNFRDPRKPKGSCNIAVRKLSLEILAHIDLSIPASIGANLVQRVLIGYRTGCIIDNRRMDRWIHPPRDRGGHCGPAGALEEAAAGEPVVPGMAGGSRIFPLTMDGGQIDRRAHDACFSIEFSFQGPENSSDTSHFFAPPQSPGTPPAPQMTESQQVTRFEEGASHPNFLFTVALDRADRRVARTQAKLLAGSLIVGCLCLQTTNHDARQHITLVPTGF